METRKRFARPGIHAALIIFIFVILYMLFVFSYAQYYWGMWGLLVTELGILLIALVGMVLFNVDFKKAFPIRKIKINQIAGVILLWGGAFLLIILVSFIVLYFYPQGLETGESLEEFASEWHPVAALLLISVAPAICEEALHRGVLQYCIWTTFKNRWITCFLVGLLFGINHLDLTRLLSTGILGMVMAYILIETDNFWYNMMFHFMNNFIVEGFTYIYSYIYNSGNTIDAATRKASMQEIIDILPLSIACYLVIGCVIPELLLGGAMLLKGMRRLKTWSKTKVVVSIVTAVSVSVIMLFAGMMLFVYLYSIGMIDDLSQKYDLESVLRIGTLWLG